MGKRTSKVDQEMKSLKFDIIIPIIGRRPEALLVLEELQVQVCIDNIGDKKLNFPSLNYLIANS